MSRARNDKKADARGASDEPDSGDSSASKGSADDIEPGMEVETSGGDLGERDISKATVKEVERNASGETTQVIVEKGDVFRKTIEVPADRVEAIETNAGQESSHHPDTRSGEAGAGKVTLDTSKQEIRHLSATGSEALSPEPKTGKGGAKKPGHGATEQEAHDAARADHSAEQASAQPRGWLRILGPGLLSGMAGNDSSAVTTYSINGATNGYSQLWLMLLSTPLYQAVQYACAKVGRVTQKGLSDLLREHYGQKVALPASLILVVSNTALIAADLVAIGTGVQLITGVAWEWFVVPVALGLWYLVVYESFRTIKRIFLGMSLAFSAYLVCAALSGANWGMVLRATFVPHIPTGLAAISSAVGLLGATISPYTIYWQVQGEKEQKRPGKPKQQFRLAAFDIAVGTISGNLVAYAIIICTSASLFTHHKTVRTAADAAAALAPLLGSYAKYLFALGFIGGGLIAIPVLMASTSYGLSGIIGWSASLWNKPWQSEGFYLIMSGALLVSMILALLGFDPIELMFWANVLQGILSPVLIVFLILVGNNRKVMGKNRLGILTNTGLILSGLVMSAATILFFFGLITHQGG